MARTNGHNQAQPGKAAAILLKAKELSTRVESWADFSNALFDPEDGLVAQTFPRLNDRQRFFESKEYAAVERLLSQLMRRFGVANGATPRESGQFLVRLPRTLRLALERESADEGVSLDQLVLAKLAIPLAVRAGGRKTS
jgi:hypothetical protein